jgi:hypothetical protein
LGIWLSFPDNIFYLYREVYYGLNAIESFDPFADSEEEAMEIDDMPPIIQAAINGGIESVRKLAIEVKDMEVEDYTGYTVMTIFTKAI